MMIYLLAYVYDKDSYSHCKRQAYRHKNKNVIRKFQYMVIFLSLIYINKYIYTLIK